MCPVATNQAVETSPTLRLGLGLMAVLMVCLAVVYWPGCRQYPEATHPQTLRLIKLLYTACNTQSEPRLAEFEKELQAIRQTSALSTAEEQAFTAIIDLARQGHWTQAQDQCYKFAQDQVR